ncbi:Small GTPase superfamily [Ascosphaera apis ARSEF 7405]|uniref:Small GTPase superfamily n=1 Tax=Ascosphaera apis ARSEF 7405 TaxID=392613 RepID=A0A168A6X0_9EURO|nr:Small GTPase superfamily [Ascosphaera apis ARSEF 7405]
MDGPIEGDISSNSSYEDSPLDPSTSTSATATQHRLYSEHHSSDLPPPPPSSSSFYKVAGTSAPSGSHFHLPNQSQSHIHSHPHSHSSHSQHPHPHPHPHSHSHAHTQSTDRYSSYSADYSQASVMPPTNHGLDSSPPLDTYDRRQSGDSVAFSQTQPSSSPAMSYQQGYREAASSPRPPSQLSTSTTGERERERERQHREREREQRERERVDNRQEYLQAYQEPAPRPQPPPSRNSVVIKVGMVGDAQIGKTSLMVKYVEGSWDEDYIQTLGVNFMEKTISIRNTEITFSIWDLGGQREFVNMLPLVCNDAVALLFMFDLTRKSTLNSIKEWYRQGRGFNKTAIPFLVGTKYDHFVNFPREDQEEISIQAKRFAKAMKASLIFSSTSHSINVQKIFKIVLAKAFDLKCTIPEIENIGEPLLLYQNH